MAYNIVITGINGFVGGSLANYFAKKGFQISGVGRQPKLAAFVDPSCTYIQADITEPLKPFQADVVIHSAACANDRAQMHVLYKNNVIGTSNVLKASAGAHRFIQISTSSVYSFDKHPVTEQEAGQSPDRLSGYGKTKYMAEQRVLADKHIPNKCILRPRAIYGINDRLILPRLLQLIKGNYLLLPSNTTRQISLTHIDNFINAVELSIHASKIQAVYNVSDGPTYALDEVITHLLRAVVAKPLHVKKIPSLVWESLITCNEYLAFNQNLSRFGSDQLTKPAMLNINRIKSELNYLPEKTMHTSYEQIGTWISELGGWKKYLESNRLKAA